MEENTEYPKILLINVITTHDESATGITIRNIFEAWPSEKKLELSLQYSDEPRENTLYLKENSICFDFMLRKLLRIFQRKKEKHHEEKIVKVETHNNNNILKKEVAISAITQYGIKSSLHDMVRGLLDMSRISVPSSVLTQIDSFSPHVIYTLGGSIRVLKMVKYFSKRYSIKSVLHLMDNWPDTIYTTSKLSFMARRSITSLLKWVNGNSQCSLAISEKMSNEYQKRYGIEYVSMMNCVSYITEDPIVQNQKLVYLYAGGLHLGRSESLIKIAKCLGEANKIENRFILHIYTSEKSKELYQADFYGLPVVFKNAFHNDNVQQILLTADVLLHIESFSSNINKYTKYSISTKIPEYMAANRPILCYAPSSLASSEYIKECHSGLVASNEEELKLSIQNLEDLELRKELAGKGVRMAMEKHMKDKIHNSIYAVICKNA